MEDENIEKKVAKLEKLINEMEERNLDRAIEILIKAINMDD